MDHSSFNLRPGLVELPSGLGENSQDVILPMKSLTSTFFRQLNDRNIRWAVLRNAEGLPEFTRYDIDLLVHPSDMRDAQRLLYQTACAHGWYMIGSIRKRAYRCRVYCSPNEVCQFLPFDFFSALEYRGVRFADTVDLLAKRQLVSEQVWALPIGTAAAITLLKELLPHGALKRNSRSSVRSEVTNDGKGFVAQLARSGVPQPLAEEMREAIVIAAWDRAEQLSPLCTKEIERHATHKWTRRIHMLIMNVSHLFRKSPGRHIVLVGPDGSGKTTLAREVMSKTFKRPFKAVRYIHGNFGILPRFRDIRAKLTSHPSERAPAAGEEMSGMVPTLPLWKSSLLAAYYACDCLLGRVLVRRWKSQWSLIISDRSFLDYYFQRGHGRLPTWYLRMLNILVGRPDLILAIRRAPEAIHRCKPELTVEEIRHEQAVMARVLAGDRRVVWIDGDAGVQSSAQQIVTALMNSLFNRPDAQAREVQNP